MKKLSWINIYRQNILQGNSFPWSEVITNISQFKFKNKLHFLEIGCGTGSNGLFISKKHHYTGIDISKEIIDLGKKKFNNFKKIKLIHSDINNFEIKKKYDFLLDRFCLTHVDPTTAKNFINKFENNNGKKYFLGFFFKKFNKNKYLILNSNSKIKVYTEYYNKNKVIKLFKKKIKILICKDVVIKENNRINNTYLIFGCRIIK